MRTGSDGRPWHSAAAAAPQRFACFVRFWQREGLAERATAISERGPSFADVSIGDREGLVSRDCPLAIGNCRMICFSSRERSRALVLAFLLPLVLHVRAASADEREPRASLPARDQLDADVSLVPDGLGTIFVPALEATAPADVSVVVRQDGKTVAIGSLGRKLPVPPGHYTVFVGAGPIDARASTEVDVTEGRTSDVAPDFGVLRVALVDPRGRPVEDTFTIANVTSGRSYGPFTTVAREGARPTIPLYLPRGHYSLALGSNARAEEGSFACTVVGGEILPLKVVVDDGRLVRTDVGEADVAPAKGPWKLRWVLAADGSLGSRSNQLGSFNGQSLMIGGFTKLDLALDTGRHLASFSLLADESAVGILAGSGTSTSETPVQKLTDDVRAELAYTYRLGGVVGPYAHGMAMTSLLPTRYHPGRALDATTLAPDGSVARQERFQTGESYRLFPEMGPLVLQQGAGVGTAFEGDVVRFALRGGVAARQAFFFDGRYPVELAGDNLRLQQIGDVKTFGAEASATLGMRVHGLVDLDSRLDAFLGEDQFGALFDGVGTYRPVYRWDNSAAVRLGKFVSLVYTFGLRRDAQAIERDQVAHTLRLRFAWSVF